MTATVSGSDRVGIHLGQDHARIGPALGTA